MVKFSTRNAKGFSKPLLTGALLAVIAQSPASAYELIDLGANVVPKAVNNAGVIVGSSNTDPYTTTAFSWSTGSGFEFIDGTSANGVNDAGQIVGTTITGAFLLDGSNYSDWSELGAFGVNQWGAVAGYEVGSNPYQPRSLPYNPAIFDGHKWTVFDIAKIYPRGTRQGVYADRFILNGINTDGYTVGYKYRYGLAGSSAFLIDPNMVVNDAADVFFLPTPGGGTAADINDQNRVVGTTGNNSATTPTAYPQAYVYSYDTDSLTVLPLLDGGLRSSANDINELNQVVGTAETLIDSTRVYHAFIWDETDGVSIDLNDWLADGSVAAPGWVLTSANAVNDSGDIVGVGLLNGVEHGFMLTTGQAMGSPPLADAGADITSGKAPLTVNFDASGSADPDGAIVAYDWDFSDGSSSADANPSHEFTSPGTYLVSLSVTDDQGMQASSALTISVEKTKAKGKGKHK